MIYLSDSAIHYAVNLCHEFHGYKVVIASNDRAVRGYVIDEIAKMVAHGNDNFINHRSDNTCLVVFPNSSYIKLINAQDNARGHRAHMLIVDINIDKKTVDCVLRPYEILACYQKPEWCDGKGWYNIQ